MPSNYLILCHPLLLLPSLFPNIRVFSNESALYIRWPKYWSFSISISPSNEYSELIFFRIDWLDLLVVQGTLKIVGIRPRSPHRPNWSCVSGSFCCRATGLLAAFSGHQAHACPRVFALAVPSPRTGLPGQPHRLHPIPLKSLFLGQRHSVASWATDIRSHSYPAFYVFIALRTTCHCLVHLYQIISLLLERNSVWAYLDSAHSQLHPRCRTRCSVKMRWGK